MGKYPWSDKETSRREERRPKLTVKKYYIRPVAKNTAVELAIYYVLSKDFLKDNPVCQCGRNGCRRPSQEVHHKKGRGILLNVVEFFLAVARVCHRWIEDNPKEAKRLGLSLSRLTKN